ncbi:MAG: 16S rRNA (guanine(527)-N(7))-methyltransferase RsmG, partial [Burkholderiales bacterium]
PSAVVSNHLLDSLAALPFIKAAKVLDVGSGAGLPGLVVAIARPEVSVTLLDANNKKAAFLQQAVANLALPNARVVCTRVETWRPGEFFPAIVSRAFAALKDFIAGTKELLAPGGRFYAMKGQYPADEIAQLPRGFRVVDVVSLEVPGLAARRHLVIVEEEHVR